MQISGTFSQIKLLETEDTDDGPTTVFGAKDHENQIIVILTTSDRAVLNAMLDAYLTGGVVAITGVWVRQRQVTRSLLGITLTHPEIAIRTVMPPAPAATQGADETREHDV